MQEIERCVNQRPVYESGSKEIYEWDNPLAVAGETSERTDINYHPFVIDIETSAELGQRPILLVGYNSLEDRLILLYSHGYQGYEIGKQKIQEFTGGLDPAKITVHNLSQSNVEKFILRPIAEWNKKAKRRGDKNRISLIAHNAEFDIPMLGSPDDELLDNAKIGNQYEQSVRYKYINMIGHRAGQFGHIFTFLDGDNNYDHLHIPLGDTMVAAKAIWIGASLENACNDMDIGIDVSAAQEHGNLSDEYVKYCINDVEATLRLYYALESRIHNMFGKLPIEHIYSTASIGKHILREMNYKRPGYSQEAIDRIAPAYFGGRTDAHTTGEIVEDLRYTDILSEYPTVSKLTDVWEYAKAETIDITQIPVSELPDISDMTEPENWKKVSDYYVKIQPNGATLPVRTPHLEDTTKVITSKVHSKSALEYHYMDVISAYLIDGEQKCEIKAAWKIEKSGMQDLEKTNIAGVDITPEDNVMSKCIESRKEIQHKAGGKNEKTKSLKITANSMYGICAERIVKEKKEYEMVKHDFAAENGFYNPHIATTITAGGRLMLALGQHITEENGGGLVYCDTDSLIIPDSCSDKVIDAFQDLNPYDGYAGTLDVLEDEKGQAGKLYATGAKKYVFFGNDGEILEAKEHGLGNYNNLRDTETIHRLWATILYYDLEHNPLDTEILYDGKLNENVYWSFNASTRSMRSMINDFSGDFIRYGDWVESTLSYDNTVRYIALNLMEKEETDKVCRVETEGEEITDIQMVEYADMIEDNTLKNVRDVVLKFTQDAKTSDKIPEVNITNTRIVTKEATSRKDVFISKLEQQFTRNMGKAVEIMGNA